MEFFKQLTYGDVVDIVCATIAIILLLRGAFRGISGELSHIIANVVVLITAVYCYRPVAAHLAQGVEAASNPVVRHVALVCGFVIAGALIAWALRAILRKSIRVIVSPPTDWALGMGCGLTGAAIVIFVAFLVCSLVPSPKFREVLSQESRVGKLLFPMVAPVSNQLAELPQVAAATNTLGTAQSILAVVSAIHTNAPAAPLPPPPAPAQPPSAQ